MFCGALWPEWPNLVPGPPTPLKRSACVTWELVSVVIPVIYVALRNNVIDCSLHDFGIGLLCYKREVPRIRFMPDAMLPHSFFLSLFNRNTHISWGPPFAWPLILSLFYSPHLCLSVHPSTLYIFFPLHLLLAFLICLLCTTDREWCFTCSPHLFFCSPSVNEMSLESGQPLLLLKVDEVRVDEQCLRSWHSKILFHIFPNFNRRRRMKDLCSSWFN